MEAVHSAVNNSVLLYKLLSVSITLINEPAVATRPQPTCPEYRAEKWRDTRPFEQPFIPQCHFGKTAAKISLISSFLSIVWRFLP